MYKCIYICIYLTIWSYANSQYCISCNRERQEYGNICRALSHTPTNMQTWYFRHRKDCQTTNVEGLFGIFHIALALRKSHQRVERTYVYMDRVTIFFFKHFCAIDLEAVNKSNVTLTCVGVFFFSQFFSAFFWYKVCGTRLLLTSM